MKRLICYILLIGPLLAFGQTIDRNVISSGGMVQQKPGITLSSTVGEVAVSSSKKNSIIITAGFQQGYPVNEEDTTSLVESSVALNLKLYPNPSQDLIFVSDPEKRNLTLTVFDGNGKLVYSTEATFNGENNPILVKEWATGKYVFQFKDNASDDVLHYQVLKQ
jgi:hypothetical protein